MRHEDLKRQAVDAAHKLHADTSVDLEKTLESLQEVHSALEACIDAVLDDIRAASKE